LPRYTSLPCPKCGKRTVRIIKKEEMDTGYIKYNKRTVKCVGCETRYTTAEVYFSHFIQSLRANKGIDWVERKVAEMRNKK
jgi:transcriptional regulator NrdR family protein